MLKPLNCTIAGWKYSEGFVSEQMLSEHMPAPGPETLIVLCGPPPMIQLACLPNLERLHYSKENIFSY